MNEIRDIYTDNDREYLSREWKLIVDLLGRIHFKDRNDEWEYMDSRL